MKIDINYSEEKEVSHIGVYACIQNGDIYLFPDHTSKTYGMLIQTSGKSRKIGLIQQSFTPCTNKEYWIKLNADSVTFNLKD